METPNRLAMISINSYLGIRLILTSFPIADYTFTFITTRCSFFVPLSIRLARFRTHAGQFIT